MISRLRTFGEFWYDFIIGDDWRVAAGIVIAFAATYGLTRWTSLAMWWLVPASVAVLLPLSLRRAVSSRRTSAKSKR